MSKEQQPLSAAGLYLTFGDQRPSVPILRGMHEELASEPIHLLAKHLTAADVAIDLAVSDQMRTDLWIEQAERSLKIIEEWPKELKEGGEDEQYAGCIWALSLARLRSAELSNWARAAKGEPVVNEYELFLRAAETVLPLLSDAQDDPARVKLAEFMLYLMGARENDRDPGSGWWGRLGLRREEARNVFPADDVNTNWDTGISLDNDPDHFINPPVKLALERQLRQSAPKERANAEAYRRGGVTPVTIGSLGLRNPQTLILTCLHEKGLLAAGRRRRGAKTVPPAHLQSVTTRIHTKILQASR